MNYIDLIKKGEDTHRIKQHIFEGADLYSDVPEFVEELTAGDIIYDSAEVCIWICLDANEAYVSLQFMQASSIKCVIYVKENNDWSIDEKYETNINAMCRRFEASDITDIGSDIIAQLRLGDCVVTEDSTYIVTYNDGGSVYLTNVLSDSVELVEYLNGNSGWSYSSTTTHSFGTKLYKHKVTLLDSGTSSQTIINFITNSSTPATSYGGGPAALDLSYNSIVGLLADYFIKISAMGDSKITLEVLSITTSSVTQRSFDTFVSDVVTLL